MMTEGRKWSGNSGATGRNFDVCKGLGRNGEDERVGME